MADNYDPFPKLGSVYKTSRWTVKQLNHYGRNSSMNSAQDHGRKVNSWEAQTRIPSDPWVPQNSAPNPWSQQSPCVLQKSNGGSGMANSISWRPKTTDSHHVVSPPLANGSKWSSEASSTRTKSLDEIVSNPQSGDVGCDKNCVSDDDDDILYDSDDDLVDLDSDSDASQKSHETRKKSKWFKSFFKILDKLSNEEINSQSGEWHCPVCKGGPGAIDWYRGLQPLMVHAKTKQTRKARLHRVFAELLDEEMCRRGTSITPYGEAFDKWEGLKETVKDHEIVWPPMVIIENTRFDQDDNGKWFGMGNQELLDYFSAYAALKARHSYGPKGHRGTSVLIFESSAGGYLEAARLHKHFREQDRDRDAWGRMTRVLFCPGGKRILYGYQAVKHDLEDFNLHSQGKSKLKFEMRSYQEMVDSQIKQINDDSQQLVRLKNKVINEQKNSQILVESLGRVREKLCKTEEENRIVRQRTKLQHEQNKEEIDAQEQFFKDQIRIIQQAIDTKEDIFEKLQLAEREKVEHLNGSSSTVNDGQRTEEIARFLKRQDKDMDDFKTEREKLIKIHQDKKAMIMRRYWEEQLKLEKEFEMELSRLMESYSTNCLEAKRT